MYAIVNIGRGFLWKNILRKAALIIVEQTSAFIAIFFLRHYSFNRSILTSVYGAQWSSLSTLKEKRIDFWFQ